MKVLDKCETDAQRCIVLILTQLGALTINELSDELNKAKIHLYSTLDNLRKANIIYKPDGSNRYFLTDFRQGC